VATYAVLDPEPVILEHDVVLVVHTDAHTEAGRRLRAPVHRLALYGLWNVGFAQGEHLVVLGLGRVVPLPGALQALTKVDFDGIFTTLADVVRLA